MAGRPLVHTGETRLNIIDKAHELHTSGFSSREITDILNTTVTDGSGELVHVSKTWIHKQIQDYDSALQPMTYEELIQERNRSKERKYQLMKSFWLKAMDGHLPSAKFVLQVDAALSLLLGLDQPTKQQLEVNVTSDPQVMEAELLDLKERLGIDAAPPEAL